MADTENEKVDRDVRPAMGPFLKLWWREIAGAIVVLVSRLLTDPLTYWESDEMLFGAALRRFDPWNSHPHPPGYPLYVGLGKLFLLFAPNAFTALRALSIVSCVLGFIVLAIVYRRCLGGDRTLAVCAALIFYFTPALLIHGTLPLSDSPAILFIALALLAAMLMPEDVTDRSAIAFGLACSAVIGVRPQLAVVILPLAAVCLARSTMRRAITATTSFTILCIAWFEPLVEAAGGWDRFVEWERHQMVYVASHDAVASRGSASVGALLVRFVFHPFGPKTIAVPVLLMMIAGA
ncbi:MAG: glycosyltransferase family 39 protein, partial [Acidobacteriota bacterium]